MKTLQLFFISEKCYFDRCFCAILHWLKNLCFLPGAKRLVSPVSHDYGVHVLNTGGYKF